VVFRVKETDFCGSRGQHLALYRAICCYSQPRQCCNSNTTLAIDCALGLLVQSRSEQETECLFVVIGISSVAMKTLTLRNIHIRLVSKMPAYFSTSRSSHSNTSSGSTNTHYNTCNLQHVHLLSHLRRRHRSCRHELDRHRLRPVQFRTERTARPNRQDQRYCATSLQSPSMNVLTRSSQLVSPT
jgi:hypothetical protein